MITTVNGLVKGPYAPGQEDRFKADVLREWASRNDGWTYFQIENEEKEPGFPDAGAFSANCYLLANRVQSVG
jgi:hypothetical protein